MRAPKIAPIPKRIPPLQWRRPAFVWTPLALALALGLPALAFNEESSLADLVLVAGALVFASAFVSLGVAWAIGRPPRTRREAMLHLIVPGVIVALSAPLVFESLVHIIATAQSDTPLPQATALPDAVALATAPLALLLGLPIVLFAALAFSLAAFTKVHRVENTLPERPAKREVAARRAHDFQPFD